MPIQETAIEIIDVPQVAILPTAAESATQAIERQLAFVGAINHLINETFVDGIHYATIPGTSKPTLMLPGIEMARGLLGVREVFNDIHVIRDMTPDNPFFYFEVECVLIHIHTGLEIGRGQAVCHTREKSFMRQQDRTCPNCGKETIKKSKYPPRDNPSAKPGWYCFTKIDGCGAEFAHDDESIISQSSGMINDTQLVWDGLNRARKIANKRAKADAIKNAAMLSERFTVDMEDIESPSVGQTWASDESQVKKFYAQCHRLPLPPAEKQQIFDALGVASIKDCNLSMVDAILTVSEHMAEFAKLEADTPDTIDESQDNAKKVVEPIENKYRQDLERIARAIDMKLIHKIEPHPENKSYRNERYIAHCNYEDGDHITPLEITLFREHVQAIIAHCGLDWQTKRNRQDYPAYEFDVPCGIITCWDTGRHGDKSGYMKYFEVVLTDENPATRKVEDIPEQPEEDTQDGDIWTRLYQDKQVLKAYNNNRYHISGALEKYTGVPSKDGFEAVKTFLIDRKAGETPSKSKKVIDMNDVPA